MNVWLLFALVVLASVAVAVGTILFANRVMSDGVGNSHNSTLSPFLTTVALVYGALLGFTVVVAWEQFSSAEANVATKRPPWRRCIARPWPCPSQEQREIRVLLRKYTTAVQGPEWRKQERTRAGTSDSARSAITDMYRVLGRSGSRRRCRRRSTASSSAS